MPEPAPSRQADPLLDPDINWRSHAGLRAPVETAPIPKAAREKFNENWERLASEPPRRPQGQGRGHSLKKSAFTRWLYHDGRLDFINAFGSLLLLGLLAAAIIYGSKMLTGSGGNPHTPAAGSRPN